MMDLVDELLQINWPVAAAIFMAIMLFAWVRATY
jgi:hypothetical protein